MQLAETVAALGSTVTAARGDIADLKREIHGNGQPGIKERLIAVEENEKMHAEFIEKARDMLFKAVCITSASAIVSGGLGSFLVRLVDSAK